MTLASNAFTSYLMKGGREHLSDFIYDVSPTDTPFMSNAGRGSAEATLFEWQTDTLAAAVTNNQQLEGDVVSGAVAATVATVRLGNYCEIARKSFGVTGTEQKAKKAGRQDEVGYQGARKIKELKRDMESSFLANKAADAGGATTVRVTAGMGAWLKTNIDKAAGDGSNPSYTTLPNTPRTDGTQRAFTETIAKSVIQQVWTSGGDISTIMVGAVNKQVASTFSGVAQKNFSQSEVAQTKIIGAADIYVSDFGVLRIVPNRFQRSRDAWFLDFNLIEVAYFRDFEKVDLAVRGDAVEKMILAEYGLKIKNEKGLGAAVDLS